MSSVLATRPAVDAFDPAISRLTAGLLTLLALGFGGCAQRPQDVVASHGKEYFPASVYGPASKRVVADGQPVPRGGGQYLVGKPYTIAGRTYYPSESRTTKVGYASWYGDAFHGRLTANGEIYDRDAFTAASPTMPLPSYARVTNLRNNYSMIVRVNDRGPYASDRIMDVSRRVAEALDYKRYGTTMLKVEYVGRASLAGSDDSKLYATLRTDRPDSGASRRTMVAQITPRARLASNAPSVEEGRRRQRITGTGEDGATPEIPDDLPRQVGLSRSRQIMAASAVKPDHEHSRLFESQELSIALRRREIAAPVEDGNLPRHVNHERRNGAKYVAGRGDQEAGSRETKRRTTMVRNRVADDPKIVMPPSRPMDLGTIPGASSQIHVYRDQPRFRLARSHEN